jgi:hypothetical protein
MSYDYMFFQPTHRLASHEEIEEGTVLPFASKDEILALLRQVYPNATVDTDGYGWLDPEGNTGALHLPDDDGYPVFHISRIWRHEVQKLCNALGLTAFDGQKLELVQPE